MKTIEKTISFETSKHIQSVIKDVETEYYYEYAEVTYILSNGNDFQEWDDYKTLTTDEAIDILPETIWNEDNWTHDGIAIMKRVGGWYYIEYYNISFDWDTLIESIEKMLLYLYDNKLLK